MIELKDLQKIVDPGRLINVPWLEVKAGEIAALVGTVDSGKDELFQLLIGRIRPTSGHVRLAGLDPYRERADFSRQVGVLFSEDNLYKHLSAKEICSSTVACGGCRKHARSRCWNRWAWPIMPVSCAEKLSPGLSRRLALGRAFLNQPKVLLLADPFAGCEQVSIDLICQVVRKLAGSGTAVMIFAHDAEYLEMLCDTVYRLDQGRIVNSFDPREQQQRQRPFMVPARGEEKIILIDPADILYVFAQDDRAYLQTSQGTPANPVHAG